MTTQRHERKDETMIPKNNASMFKNLTVAIAAYEKTPVWSRQMIACPKSMLDENGKPTRAYFLASLAEWLIDETDETKAERAELEELERREAQSKRDLQKIIDETDDPEKREVAKKLLECYNRA